MTYESVDLIGFSFDIETYEKFYHRYIVDISESRTSLTELHRVTVEVEEKISYTRGRPPKNGKRKVSRIRYVLKACIEEKSEQVKQKQTTRPTAFMMSTKFTGLQVVRVAGMCRLAMPLTDGQKRYLNALNLSQADLLGQIDGAKSQNRL